MSGVAGWIGSNVPGWSRVPNSQDCVSNDGQFYAVFKDANRRGYWVFLASVPAQKRTLGRAIGFGGLPNLAVSP
jgi:hypothetical protein